MQSPTPQPIPRLRRFVPPSLTGWMAACLCCATSIPHSPTLLQVFVYVVECTDCANVAEVFFPVPTLRSLQEHSLGGCLFLLNSPHVMLYFPLNSLSSCPVFPLVISCLYGQVDGQFRWYL